MVSKSNSELSERKTRIIAIVSGKGGSGKTMIAAEIAKLADGSNSKDSKIVLVDTDLGTGGLTYFLNLEYVVRQIGGLADMILNDIDDIDDDKYLQKLQNFNNSYFFGIGSHRQLIQYKKNNENFNESVFRPILKKLISTLVAKYQLIIIDCRGGIDEESLIVCDFVDDILLIVESDTTSFQASQYLVDVLSQNQLTSKLKGFIINKVIDNPKVLARTGSGSFRCQYLGSIPFDLETTRNFLIGKIPEPESLFGIHIGHALHKIYPDQIDLPKQKKWDFSDYEKVGLSDPDSTMGGFVSAIWILLNNIMLILLFFSSDPKSYLYGGFAILSISISISIFGLLGSIERTRRLLGRGINLYFKTLSKLLR